MKLRDNKEFSGCLQSVLVGYLNSMACVSKLKQTESGQEHQTVDEKKLCVNGEKLSRKFNGEEHILTLRFRSCLVKLSSSPLTKPQQQASPSLLHEQTFATQVESSDSNPSRVRSSSSNIMRKTATNQRLYDKKAWRTVLELDTLKSTSIFMILPNP